MSQTEAKAPPKSAATTILRASGIKKNFQMGDSTVQVLRHVDFSVKTGEFVAIEGRSGSGKSTLLHILGALEMTDGGALEFDADNYTLRTPPPWSVRRFLLPRVLGDWLRVLSVLSILLVVTQGIWLLLWPAGDVWHKVFWRQLPATIGVLLGLAGCLIEHERRERPRARLRNRKFGFVFQFYYLLPELNVLENALLAAKVQHSYWGYRLRRGELRKNAIELLEQLGLGHRLKHRPNQLSGGERQRVAIARALMNQPRILFADEPTGNLDIETGRQIMTVLEKLHRDHNQTIVMVTHDRAIARQADRVLVLRDGALQNAGE